MRPHRRWVRRPPHGLPPGRRPGALGQARDDRRLGARHRAAPQRDHHSPGISACQSGDGQRAHRERRGADGAERGPLRRRHDHRRQAAAHAGDGDGRADHGWLRRARRRRRVAHLRERAGRGHRHRALEEGREDQGPARLCRADPRGPALHLAARPGDERGSKHHRSRDGRAEVQGRDRERQAVGGESGRPRRRRLLDASCGRRLDALCLCEPRSPAVRGRSHRGQLPRARRRDQAAGRRGSHGDGASCRGAGPHLAAEPGGRDAGRAGETASLQSRAAAAGAAARALSHQRGARRPVRRGRLGLRRRVCPGVAQCLGHDRAPHHRATGDGVLAGRRPAGGLFASGREPRVQALQGVAQRARVGVHADARARGERQRAAADRQGQRAAALPRRSGQGARAGVRGGRRGRHVVPKNDGGDAGRLPALTRDGRLLFITRSVRLFAYGALAVILVVYLTSLGLSASQTGLLLTLTLVGDTVVSLYLTTRADRLGRRRMLILGALLMTAAGVAFAWTRNFLVLVVAGTIGVISPSGNEVGPFLPIEQAALAQVVPAAVRTTVFAWYTLAGSFATASGSLCGGALAHALQGSGSMPIAGYRVVVLLYAALGAVLALLFTRLSPATEVAASDATATRFGIGRSRAVVLRLSGLFALDAFAGGFVIQSFAAYWFYLRFDVNPATLGMIFFWANVFAGVSALLASRLAARFGLVRTMVFTHLPSNVLLILVPLMPTLPLAVVVLLARF